MTIHKGAFLASFIGFFKHYLPPSVMCELCLPEINRLRQNSIFREDIINYSDSLTDIRILFQFIQHFGFIFFRLVRIGI